jgi:RNA polymerase sigma-70 factor, ECF subfamily
LDELKLIESLKKRDTQALAAVFEQYANKIYRLALGILDDEQQADGVVQDTFLKLIKHIDNFEGRSNIGTWLYRVGYNEAQQRLRRIKPQVSLTELEADDLLPTCFVDWQAVPEHQLSSNEALEMMTKAIQELSPALRTVFILRDEQELSTQETAEILAISESAVKVRLHRARLALREKLATYFTEYVTI